MRHSPREALPHVKTHLPEHRHETCGGIHPPKKKDTRTALRFAMDIGDRCAMRSTALN